MNVILSGSFDPPTLGHLYLAQKTHALFSSFKIVIASNPAKKPLLSPEQRIKLWEKIWADENTGSRISVLFRPGLLADYLIKNQVDLIIRGLRNQSDFQTEKDMASLNRRLAPQTETLFLPVPPQYEIYRSAYVRELYSYGADIASLVPPAVNSFLMNREKNG